MSLFLLISSFIIKLHLFVFPHTDPVNITMDGQNVIQTSFEPTEIMSSYLLAFVVCDFAFNGTQPGADVLVIITARTIKMEIHL